MEDGLASVMQEKRLLGNTITNAVIIQVTEPCLSHTFLHQEGLMLTGGSWASSIPTTTLVAV